MRPSLLALAIGLALSPFLALADNSSLNSNMASNPELGSYQSSSLNPSPLPEYQDANQVYQQQNATINQALNQVTNVGDGFAVGAQAGMTSGVLKTNVNYTQKDIQTLAMPGLSGGVHIDYGQTFSNQFYLGSELYANLAHSASYDYAANGAANFNAKIENNMGFAILPGYQISPASLIYAKLGINIAKLVVSSYPTDPGDKATTSPGADLGVGFRQALSQNLSLALEYDWYVYNARIITVNTNYSTSRFMQNLFQLSLNYQLDNMDPNNVGSRPALAFDTPYVGVNVGSKSQTVDNNTSNINGSNTDTDIWSGTGFTESLVLGYGHQFNSWFYLAGEVLAQTNQGVSPQELGISFLQERSSYGLSLLPGYILNQSNIMFARIGALHTHFIGTENGGTGTEFNTYKTGVELGLGYETALTQYLSLAAEYDWTLYPLIRTLTGNDYNSYKIVDQVFSLGLNYHF
jgi:opacity protein-like surface antigen